jgi:hypothetical protein
MEERRRVLSDGCCYSIHMRIRRLLVFGLLLIFAPAVSAYDVVLKNGAVIHFQKYRVSNDRLIYTSESGREESVALSDVNLAATRDRNENADPPLALPGLYPTPLGDIARQSNLKPQVDPKGYVFTNDDFPSSPPAPQPANIAVSSSSGAGSLENHDLGPALSRAKIEQFIVKTESLTDRQYTERILGPDLAVIEFPKRSEWQVRIYEAHRRYLSDAKLCISDRVSDIGRRQDLACARLDSDKITTQSMRDEGRQRALDWKTRQEKFVQ